MRVQSFIVDNRRGLRAHCRAESVRTNDNLIDWQGSPLTDCYEWWLCSLSLVIGCMLMIFQVRPLLGQGKWNFQHRSVRSTRLAADFDTWVHSKDYLEITLLHTKMTRQ